MMNSLSVTVWVAAVLCAAGVVCCNSGPESDPFKAPSDTGRAECLKFTSWPSSTAACSECLHEHCASAYQVAAMVCPQNTDDKCRADAGVKLDSGVNDEFCYCMVGQANGCGAAYGNVYACFVDRCAKECGGG